MRESWVHKIEEEGNLFEFLKMSSNGRKEGIEESKLPENIIKQLSEWSLFSDVPFQYYVPREDMLPSETIRFFYLDHNWVLHMMDGSCSVGRTTKIDYQNDKAMIEQIYQEALHQNANIRKRKQHKPVTLLEHDAVLPICTGFLLNSVLVKCWRGMEFKAYDVCNNVSSANELTAIRIETLGDNVLLCLFRGEIKRIEISHPPEGLHYGFAIKKGNEIKQPDKYEKALRSLVTGEILYKTATGTKEAVTVPVAVKSRQVIDWQQTAHNIAEGLPKEAFLLDTASHEDAALIALQMIQNAYTGIIRNE